MPVPSPGQGIPLIFDDHRTTRSLDNDAHRFDESYRVVTVDYVPVMTHDAKWSGHSLTSLGSGQAESRCRSDSTGHQQDRAPVRPAPEIATSLFRGLRVFGITEQKRRHRHQASRFRPWLVSDRRFEASRARSHTHTSRTPFRSCAVGSGFDQVPGRLGLVTPGAENRRNRHWNELKHRTGS